ncbi:MAG: IS66 family insertion sequence element accessory protein TnpB [Balneolales bacterium]
MFSLSSTNTYHLYRGTCDMRKSFNGLSGLVRSELGREPTSGEVFIFINRRRTHIKLLHWQSGGYVLWYKRLEQGTFPTPRIQAHQSQIRWPDLVMMIEGIRVERSVQLPRYQVIKNGEKT